MPTAWELARRSEEHVKGMVLPGTMFEEMGFNYIGPIDGHDLSALVATLAQPARPARPQFLHVVTQQGQGLRARAEADPIKWHGPGPLRPGRAARIFKEKADRPDVFAGVRPVAVRHGRARTRASSASRPAMREGSGLVEFEALPGALLRRRDRRAACAVTLAAGLACDGLRPVVAIYSTFLQRGYDQLIHDVALQNLPVVVRDRSRAASSAAMARRTRARST